jgi:hypothetical protein
MEGSYGTCADTIEENDEDAMLSAALRMSMLDGHARPVTAAVSELPMLAEKQPPGGSSNSMGSKLIAPLQLEEIEPD